MSNKSTKARTDVERRLGSAFAAWVDGVLAQPIPDSVVAFCFNMYEHEESWAIGVMGSPQFNPSSEDWAFSEVFEYREPVFEMPRSVVGDCWEQGLDAGTRLVLAYLDKAAPSSRLRTVDAIGIGFVDGDVHVIWRRGP